MPVLVGLRRSFRHLQQVATDLTAASLYDNSRLCTGLYFSYQICVQINCLCCWVDNRFITSNSFMIRTHLQSRGVTQSYNLELQRQRCKIYTATNSTARF
jgi:hypothetical protein